MIIPPINDCARVGDAIQSRLDGSLALPSDDLLSHMRTCAECRAMWDAAERLAAAVSGTQTLSVASEWTERMVGAALADRATMRRTIRRRWRHLIVWAGAAAVLTIAFGIARSWFWSQRPNQEMSYNNKETPFEATSPLDLRENLADASTAVWSLTSRTAEDAIEPAKSLLPTDVNSPWRPNRDLLAGAIEPAGQTLDEVRVGAAASFEPMTTTARRAFAMFTRELPVNPPQKPDS